jgi:cytochrome c1
MPMMKRKARGRGVKRRLASRLPMIALCLGFFGCGNDAPPKAASNAGDAERGRLLLRQYGCGSCHAIPGVAAATANVGPPLEGVARRVYLGGVLPNTRENMALWIRDPQRFDPLTAMPDMQVPEQEARDMVAYLYRERK